MANPLVQMQNLGQSPWHDNIRRSQLTSGLLEQMVAAGDITGLTSNPTIFQQAIADSSDYDADLKKLARQGKSAKDIFYALAIDDLRNAADVFRSTYDRLETKDGYVSLECAPDLAYDTKATIDEARRLWRQVKRPNLMIKIPATKEGLPAIEQCISEGINVNVTLVFSIRRHLEVMDAFLRGLIRRHETGKRIEKIASVASFFVSRVDSLIDKILEDKILRGDGDRHLLESLKGKAAIANAKLAYREFQKKFSTEAYGALARFNAQKQRPLWASTSTKNPKYPDTYYVDALIGPESVDTMPPNTIDAYRDHGNPLRRIDLDVDQATRVMEELDAIGIDMDWATQKLEDDGVRSFADSFQSLLETIEERRKAALVGYRKRPSKSAPAKASKKPAVRKAAKKTAAKKVSAKKKPASSKKAAPKKSTAKKTAAKPKKRKPAPKK